MRASNELGSGTRRRMLQRDSWSTLLVIGYSCILLLRTANACYKDAADLHAELEQYPQAISRYEQVANGSLSSALTKYSVKEYWLRASLCALAMGVSSLIRMLCSEFLTCIRK